MTDIALKCSCGKVRGLASNITPDNGNRVVCCCVDCQAFGQFLGREGDMLDEFGGTDLFQTSQSQIRIDEGSDQLRCVRVTPKGLIRWYTDCCKTPIGNTMNGSMPFIGVVHSIMDHSNSRDTDLGPVRAHVQTQYAIGNPTYPHSAKKFPLGITLRIIGKMLSWKIRGLNKPSAFFNADGTPVVQPTTPDA